MNGPEFGIELMHGYTYSGHPLACAAVIGTMDTIQDNKIFENAAAMAKPLEDAVHSLKDKPFVEDIRNCGILAGIQLKDSGDPDDPGRLPREASYELFRRGVMVRYTGPNLYLSPPLILDENHIDRLVTSIGEVLDDMAA